MTLDYIIKEFDSKTASSKIIDSYLDLLDSIHQENYPEEDPQFSREARKNDLLKTYPLIDCYRFVAIKDDDEVIGSVYFYLPNEKNPSYSETKHTAWFWINVNKNYRKNGLGSKLLETIVIKLLNFNEVSILQTYTFSSSGRSFCERFNGKIALLGAQSRLKISEVDWELMQNWVENGEKLAQNLGTKMILFEEVPEEIAESYVKFYSNISDSVPRGDLEQEYRETKESRRTREETFREMGIKYCTLATQETDGTFSGMTEINYSKNNVLTVEQELTAVSLDHRGKGLGKWLKAAMLFYIKDNFPQAQFIDTGNADSNEAMLSINQRMGFKKHLIERCYKFELDNLIKEFNIK